MILRRLSDNLRTQNWLAIAIELVIVVIGVFIGIQVANWNTARLERNTAQTYITRIREDLAANVTDMQARIAYYEWVKTHAMEALAAFERPPEAIGAQFLIDAYQASQIVPRTFGRNTYDEVLSVGGINSISDVDMRRRLANFYLTAQTREVILRYIPPYRESLRRHMPYAVQAQMTKKCSERLGADEQGAPVVMLPEQCSLDLSPDELSAAVAAVTIPEIELDLNRSLADLDSKLTMFQDLIDRAQSLDAYLAKAAP